VTNAHAVTTEPTEFTVPGGLPVRDLYTVSCPVCGVSGPWTREEVEVWRDGHDTAAAALGVAVEGAA